MTKRLPPHLKKRSNDPWSEDRIARLRDLWSQGLTGAEIGRRMGITRCAVSGMAHRLHLPPKLDEALRLNRKAAAAERKEAKARRDARADALRRAESAKRWAELAGAPIGISKKSQPVPFMEARIGQCFYPLWSGSAKIGNVCGAETGGGRFCPEHERRVYIPVRR